MDYKPNPGVLERLKQVDFVAVVGPTASGKSTLIQAAVRQDPRLHMVRSTTSRLPRPQEIGSGELHFLSRDQMLARIEKGEYVQVAPTVLGDLYATAPEDYYADGVSLMPVVSVAVPVFRSLPLASFRIVYVLPPDYASWQARISSHHFTPEQLQKRLNEAAVSLRFGLDEPACVFLVNDDLEQAVAQFCELAHTKTLSGALKRMQHAGRELAESLLGHLETSL